MDKKVTIFFDGASKGNPGPAGIGAVIHESPNRKHEIKQYIGTATNNQAEYTALLQALQAAKQLGATHVSVFGDSELVVRQLTGRYQVKDSKLKPLYEQVTSLTGGFEKIDFAHVPREKNKEADALANQAVIGDKTRSNVTMSKQPRFFEFCHPSFPREQAEIMIFGLPYEGTVNTRPGTVNGPQAIRNASAGVESYSPFYDKELDSIRFYDDGDIHPQGKGKAALDSMTEQILKRLVKGVKPIFLGGDHLTNHSPVKALVELGHKFDIVHLDAHPDFQEQFEGDTWCYATVMRRNKEILKGEIYQLGIRTGTKEELEAAKKSNKLFLQNRFEEGIKYVAQHTKGKDVYVSFDIDAVDPGLAPGTSNPVVGGMSVEQINLLISSLQGANVIGFDIVEVAPNLDPSGYTAILAAEIARDAILAWWG